MKAIILAAGMGTRLGGQSPKPLTKLANGETILQRQINALLNYIDKKDIYIVVGYKKEMIMNKFPDYNFIENPFYKNTNTSKSLLRALNQIDEINDVLWLNGDVVFERNIYNAIIQFSSSCMAVNSKPVSDEEVKYNLNDNGTIKQVSKVITDGLGEAVGINKIAKIHLAEFKVHLAKCNDNDYFERGIELYINKGLEIHPLDITSYYCNEIDDEKDLQNVNVNINKI